MTVSELIEKLRAVRQDAIVGAVPMWGLHVIRCRFGDGEWIDVTIPTDPDVQSPLR